MANIIVVGILILLIGAAVVYMVKAKKRESSALAVRQAAVARIVKTSLAAAALAIPI